MGQIESGNLNLLSIRSSARPRRPYRFFNIRDYLWAILSGYFENDLRLLFTARDRVAGEQYSFYGVIDPAGLLDRLVGGRVRSNMASQPVEGTRRNLDKYLHLKLPFPFAQEETQVVGNFGSGH